MSATASDGIPYATQVSVPSGFNPQQQYAIFYNASGFAYDPIPLAVVDQLVLSSFVRLNFQYGVLFGMSFAMLISLVALTPAEKRRLWLFKLECISLILLMVRVICQGLVFSKTIYGRFLFNLVLDWSWVTTSDGVPVGFAAFTPWVLEVSVFCCLYIQAKAIVSAERPTTRRAILASLTTFYVIAFGFKGYYYVVALIQAYKPGTPNPLNTLTKAGTWLMTVAIALFSLVFSVNVYRVIRMRINMGLRRTDTLNVLFMVSVQSMIIPVIFALVENYDTLIPDAKGLAVQSIALLLPFGSLWAGSTAFMNRQEPRRQRPQTPPPRPPIPERNPDRLENPENIFENATVVSEEGTISGRHLVNSGSGYNYDENPFEEPSAIPLQDLSSGNNNRLNTGNAVSGSSGNPFSSSVAGPSVPRATVQSRTDDELDKLYPELAAGRNVPATRRPYHQQASPELRNFSLPGRL